MPNPSIHTDIQKLSIRVFPNTKSWGFPWGFASAAWHLVNKSVCFAWSDWKFVEYRNKRIKTSTYRHRNIKNASRSKQMYLHELSAPGLVLIMHQPGPSPSIGHFDSCQMRIPVQQLHKSLHRDWLFAGKYTHKWMWRKCAISDMHARYVSVNIIAVLQTHTSHTGIHMIWEWTIMNIRLG